MPQPSMPVRMRAGIDRERGADRLADRGLGRVVVLPVRLELPAAELGQQDEHASAGPSTCGGAADGRSPSRASRAAVRASSGIPSDAAREHRLRDPEPPEQRLDRADVDVLAGVAGRHDRQLLAREVELAAAAGPEQGDQAERLHRRSQVHDPVGVAEQVEHPPGGVDLDDVPAVDRLDDPVADLAHDDRRHGPLRVARGARGTPGGARRGRGPGGGSNGHGLRG